MRRIRMSTLPKVRICRGSLALEEDVATETGTPRDVGSDASALGQAYHRMAELAQAVGPDQAAGQLVEVARQHAVDVAELRILWRKLTPEPDLGEPTWTYSEHELRLAISSELELVGHADLVRYFERWQLIEVHDWKSGWLAADEDPDAALHDQVRGYVAAAVDAARASGFPVSRARGVLQLVRSGVADFSEWNGDELGTLRDDVVSLALAADRQRDLGVRERSFRIGAHCRFCRARRACKAYRAEMDTALATISGGGPLVEVTTENAPKIYALKTLAKQLSEGLDAALKDAVEVLGPIETDDGKVFEFRDGMRRPNLTTEIAREVFTAAGRENVEDLVQELEARPQVPSRRFGLFKQKGAR